MTRLRFYADEGARHPWPHSVSVAHDHNRVARAARYLSKRFDVPIIRVDWAGKSISYAYVNDLRITLAQTCTWLIFAHEVAHLIEFHRHGSSRHGKRLALIVDEVVEALGRGPWIEHSLDVAANAVVA